MNFLGKKKQRTPKQIKIRFWIATGLVALMAFVCILPHGGRKRGANDKEDVVKTMDAQLQSFIGSDVRFPSGTALEGVEAPQLVDEPGESRMLLEETTRQLEMYKTMEKEGVRFPEGTLTRLRSRADSLKTAADVDGYVQYHVRRIKAVLPDGREMTGFQKTKRDLSSSTITNLVEKPSSVEAAEKELQEILTNQTQNQ